jgi:hypothetical protein
MGTFDLGDDDALVITGRSPECRFWNVCLWNQLLQTYNYEYERSTINGGQVRYEPDGSWTIVVAHRDSGHPNWVSPAGHSRGRIWFRCRDAVAAVRPGGEGRRGERSDPVAPEVRLRRSRCLAPRPPPPRRRRG